MGSEPLVQVSGLHRRYGALHAVRGIELELHRGDILGLLGANGAGKTTTMAMLAGVLAPSEGRIHVAGHDLLTSPLAAKARLGYLPEVPPLFPELTVDEYLQHCARLHGLGAAGSGRAAARARDRCGLGPVARRLLGNLSKGYRQRAGIAQAIVHDPEVVILDEPTSGLDPAQLREIRALIRELGGEHAVIFSTHLLPEVQSVCTRVHMIHDGQTAFAASLDALADQDRCVRLRLARPPEPLVLEALDAVAHATEIAAGHFEVTLSSDVGSTEALSRACVEAGYGLLELSPAGRSLEDLFMQVCYADPLADGHETAAC